MILNLLSNAIKYTPEGGTVRFSAENITSVGNSMTRRIIVEDNGIGISPEFLPRLFEPFAQELRPEAANIQGTGLGLSIVKKIVDLMGGTIEVHSEINKGTAFVIDLPILCEKIVAEEKSKVECAAMNLSGKHILLVEDNYLNAEIATLLLKEKGIIVTLAENGKAGIEKFASSPPGTFDAILMDIRMPVINGYEATRSIRSMERPDAKFIPIIAMTADAFEEDLRRAKDSGMDDYLTKPVNANKVYDTLSKAFQK